MVRFAESFPDARIVSALLRQLSWTHFLSIIYLEDPLQRDFYAEMCRIERWSTRTLQERIRIAQIASRIVGVRLRRGEAANGLRLIRVIPVRVLFLGRLGRRRSGLFRGGPINDRVLKE